MRGKDLIDGMGFVDERFIHEADSNGVSNLGKIRSVGTGNRHFLGRRWIAAVAVIAICCTLSVPVLAAKVPAFYEGLYAISPAMAQFFKPVQISCEDNGVRMEVTAAYIHENTAEVYISMQDLEGSRFDETIDLFDSYSIKTPFDSTAHCQPAGYDPETKTATFLLTIEQWNEQKIEGEKLTFSVREFLSNKHKYEGIISDAALAEAQSNPTTQIVEPRGFSGEVCIAEDRDSAAQTGMVVLKAEKILASPVDGAAITGVGYIGGNLHVQAYYENIAKTDNHGFLSLRNKESGEMIACSGSISFFDEECCGSYQDYIFTDIPAEALDDYELYGEFVVSDGLVAGNWSVTFPLKEGKLPQ